LARCSMANIVENIPEKNLLGVRVQK
jgi:hypothetical protein